LTDFLTALANLDEEDSLHMARILVLLRAFVGTAGTKTFDGLTKLAKVDFLLRYPRYLEKALAAKGLDKSRARLKDYERNSIESKMIRYNYGPWDPKHRRIVNLLIAKGLVEAVEGSPTLMRLTPKGFQTANLLCSKESYGDLLERALLLAEFFDMSGTQLKEFIYETFPEIVSLRRGEEIAYEDKVR